MAKGDEVTYQAAPAPLAPPSLAEQSQAITQAQISSLPAQFAAEQEFAPQRAQMQFDQYEKFAEQYSTLNQRLQDALNPGAAKIREQVTSQVSRDLGEGAPEWMTDAFMDTGKSLLGKQSFSGQGVDYLGTGMAGLEANYRNLNLNRAIGLMTPQAGVAQPRYAGSGVTGVDANTLAGMQTSQQNQYQSLLAQQGAQTASGKQQAQLANLQYGGSPWMEIAGSLAGGLATGGSAFGLSKLTS